MKGRCIEAMFNKELCINNIYNLAKQQGIKIGDLEEKAGVSRGYLSRINKPEGASPSIETLSSIAEQLGTSVDYLINYDTNSLSINGVMIIDFVEKLLANTTLARQEWSRDPFDILTKQSYNKFDLVHPLFDEQIDEDDNFGGHWVYSYEYHSLFDQRAYIAGDCYHARLDYDTTVYLMCVDSREHELMGINYELYLLVGKTIKPLCSTCFLGERIFDRISKLYSVLDSLYSHIGVDPVTKSVMQKYINGG